ncbi:MAG: hypothetical protein JO273_03295 [Methylobacteriaceae bacterium]|nr:hypothetical protein [Methylobacteriaceae bacterium]
MKLIASLLASTPLAAMPSLSVHAECRFSPFSFFPDRNDSVRVEVATDTNSFCDNSFREGPGYKFTKISVVSAPPHGIIATLGPMHYAYHALPNFKGTDQYTLKACAVVQGRHGCSTLTYVVTVQ